MNLLCHQQTISSNSLNNTNLRLRIDRYIFLRHQLLQSSNLLVVAKIYRERLRNFSRVKNSSKSFARTSKVRSNLQTTMELSSIARRRSTKFLSTPLLSLIESNHIKPNPKTAVLRCSLTLRQPKNSAKMPSPS